MSHFRRYGSQIMTPLRENPLCVEQLSRSEACCHASHLGSGAGAVYPEATGAGWPICAACPERSRGEQIRNSCPDCSRPSGSRVKREREERLRGQILRHRSVPVAM